MIDLNVTFTVCRAERRCRRTSSWLDNDSLVERIHSVTLAFRKVTSTCCSAHTHLVPLYFGCMVFHHLVQDLGVLLLAVPLASQVFLKPLVCFGQLSSGRLILLIDLLLDLPLLF